MSFCQWITDFLTQRSQRAALTTLSLQFVWFEEVFHRVLYWDLYCVYSLLMTLAKCATKTLYSSFSLMTLNSGLIKTIVLHRQLVHSSYHLIILLFSLGNGSLISTLKSAKYFPYHPYQYIQLPRLQNLSFYLS